MHRPEKCFAAETKALAGGYKVKTSIRFNPHKRKKLRQNTMLRQVHFLLLCLFFEFLHWIMDEHGAFFLVMH